MPSVANFAWRAGMTVPKNVETLKALVLLQVAASAENWCLCISGNITGEKKPPAGGFFLFAEIYSSLKTNS